MSKVDYSELLKFQKQLKNLQEADKTAFLTAAAKECAMRLWSKVRSYTPVGVYPASSGKVGGTLKRGWVVRDLDVQKLGQNTVVSIKVINPVHYASFVEYGHRTRNRTGWVEGQFMLTRSEMELEDDLPGIIERKLQQLFNGALK